VSSLSPGFFLDIIRLVWYVPTENGGCDVRTGIAQV
jgi:hypothetical protein